MLIDIAGICVCAIEQDAVEIMACISEMPYDITSTLDKGNKMDLDQFPKVHYIWLHRFIPSQWGDLVKIHLAAG